MYAYEVAAFDLDTVYGWMDSLDAFLVFVSLVLVLKTLR